MSSHPYDGVGGCGCTSLFIRLLGWIALLAGVALMATPLYGEVDIPPEMRGMSWSLAMFGVAAVLLGLAFLLDLKVKSNRTPTYRTSDQRVADPMGIARAYAIKHIRRLSEDEIKGLNDDAGIEWAQYRYSHCMGQRAHGINIFYTVGVDAFGQIVGSGYSYQPVSIGPSDYPDSWRLN